MQESKINSTLKIGILMKQTEGDKDFIAPALKTAMVFGGIAGIMSSTEPAGEGEGDLGHMPSIMSKTRELGELQDMYRRTLAATWACQTGEMAPDKLVEDIFAGGDGGATYLPPRPISSRGDGGDDSTSISDSVDSRQPVRQSSLSPTDAEKPRERRWHHRTKSQNNSVDGMSMGSNVSGRGSIEQQVHHGMAEKKKRNYRPVQEVTEFDVRDDLRSWVISDKSGENVTVKA